MTPFYNRLPGIGALGIERSADVWGAALAVGALGGIAAHAAATGISQMRKGRELPVLDQSGAPSTPTQEDRDHGNH